MTHSLNPGLIQDPKVFTSWALFYSKFISAYNARGIPIWGLTVQNEAEFAAPWEACVYSPTDQKNFVARYLGPRIKADHPDVKIMIYDHNRDHILNWVSTVFSDPDAAKYVDGTAFHIYSPGFYWNLEKAYNMFPNKFLLSTEACNCPGVILNDFGRAEAYGEDVIQDLNNFAVGWVEWNLLLNTQGGPNHLNNFCDSSVIVDVASQTVTFQPMFFYLGHFSKFIKVDSLRVPSELKAEGDLSKHIFTTTFVTPENQLVVVCMNKAESVQTVQIKDVRLQGQYLKVDLQPRSMVTLLYNL